MASDDVGGDHAGGNSVVGGGDDVGGDDAGGNDVGGDDAAAGVERAGLEVRGALETVRARVAECAHGRAVRLVAVSKTKPVALLRAAYDAGQRDFGENYVQELIEKAALMPDDTRWRFIGTLQSNKARALVHAVPNLDAVESVGSSKLADVLDRAVASSAQEPRGARPLTVFVQVNTSGEESKSGCTPSEAAKIVRHIVEHCKNLRFAGLMTIGALDYSPNPICLERLVRLRDEVARAIGSVSPTEIELSMGMSGDFEQAIALGSTSVRVGSTIFGARNYQSSK